MWLRESNAIQQHYYQNNDLWNSPLNSSENHYHLLEPQKNPVANHRISPVPGVDQTLLLLPFESQFYENVSIPHTFVGHPIIDDYINGLETSSNRSFICQASGMRKIFRRSDGKLAFKRISLPIEAKKICMLPGSRVHEVDLLLPIFQKAITILQTLLSKPLFVMVPTTSTVEKIVRDKLANWEIPHAIFLNNDEQLKYDVFSISDAAIAASGTVVLELALSRVPTLVSYRSHWLTEFIIRKRTNLNYISIPNIILNKEIIPELLFEQCTPEKIANKLRFGILFSFLR